MSNRKSGAKTLLWSVLMSAPGPLVMGLGLLAGRSSTQIADFVRRTAELLAIVMSFVVFRLAADAGEDHKRRLERRANRFTGLMMCVGGALMVILAFADSQTDKGNVIPGLAIAVMGVIANGIFWRKYTRLDRQEPDAILRVQARLYRAKTLVDSCVTIALASVAVAPQSPVSYWLDLAGSVIVAAYLFLCGIRTLRETV